MKDHLTMSPRTVEARPQREQPAASLKDAALIALFVAVVYHSASYYSTLNVEQSTLWLGAYAKTWKEVFAHYGDFGILFYRPTVYYLFFNVLGKVFDYHNLTAFRYVGWAMMMATSIMIYFFCRIVWGGSRLAAIIAGCYFAANPAIYITVIESFVSDFIGLLLLLATVLLHQLALAAELPSRRRWLLGGSILAFLLALTSRENAFLCAGFLLTITWRHFRWKGYTNRRAAAASARILQPVLVLSCAYVVVRVLSIRNWSSSGAYRTAANWDMILLNARRMFLWMAHVFWIPLHDYIDIHNGSVENGCGIIAFILAVIGWTLLMRREPAKASRDLLAIFVWVLLFLSVPVYAGYAPWHVFIPLAGYSVMAGLGIAEVFSVTIPSRYSRYVLAALLAISSVLSQQFYNVQATHPTRWIYYRLNSNAIYDPPLLRQGGIGNVLVFYEDRFGLNDWVFGGGNNLFKFVYSNPGLQERRIVDVRQLSSNDCLAWLSHGNAYYLRYTPELKWYDDSRAFAGVCLNKVVVTADAMLASGEYQEVAEMLKPIADRYLDEGMHVYQYALSLDYDGFAREAGSYYVRAMDGLPARFWAEFKDGRINAGPPSWSSACRQFESGAILPVDGMKAMTVARCGAGRGGRQR